MRNLNYIWSYIKRR